MKPITTDLRTAAYILNDTYSNMQRLSKNKELPHSADLHYNQIDVRDLDYLANEQQLALYHYRLYLLLVEFDYLVQVENRLDLYYAVKWAENMVWALRFQPHTTMQREMKKEMDTLTNKLLKKAPDTFAMYLVGRLTNSLLQFEEEMNTCN